MLDTITGDKNYGNPHSIELNEDIFERIFRPGAMSIPTVVDSFYWERKTAPLFGLFHQVQHQSTQVAQPISPTCLVILMCKIFQFKFPPANGLTKRKRIGENETFCELAIFINFCHLDGREEKM